MEDIPYEIWIHIVKYLDNPYHLLATSKYIFSLIKYLKNFQGTLIENIIKTWIFRCFEIYF